MRKVKLMSLLFAVVVAGAAHAADVDPSVALSAAKSHLAAKKYADAVAVLEPAIAGTARITDPAQQTQARTAIHFYLAVANSALQRDAAAATHLEEALRLSPNMRNIDPSRYDKRFVELFRRVKGPDAAENDGGGGRFDDLYPCFSMSEPLTVSGSAVETAVEILGTKKEKNELRSARTPADRERLMNEFWRVRDETAGTEANEFRDAALRRIAFAERHFGTPGIRGAESDRGRVFVTLGTPALVRRRPFNANDNQGMTAMNRNAIGVEVGTVELWFYNRDQLAKANVSMPTVTYRFVTHQGIGDYVLQKDGVPMTILTKVASPVAE